MNVQSNSRIADVSKVTMRQVQSASDLQNVSGGGISVPLPPPSLLGNPPREPQAILVVTPIFLLLA